MLTPEQRTHMQRAGIAVAAVLLLVVGFSAGRFAAPLQVQERLVEKLVYKDLTVEDITRGMTFTRQVEVTRWRKVTTTPTSAGPLIVDESGEHEGTQEGSTATERNKRTEEHAGAQERELVKTTTLQPNWRFGALVGGRFSGGPTGLVVGGIAERRILGGVSLAAWGLVEVDTRGPAPAVTSGIGGGGLLVEF